MRLPGDLQLLKNQNGALQYDSILRKVPPLSRKICCGATINSASAAEQSMVAKVEKNPIPQYRVESNPSGSEEEDRSLGLLVPLV